MVYPQYPQYPAPKGAAGVFFTRFEQTAELKLSTYDSQRICILTD
jgi:hypothetical protein